MTLQALIFDVDDTLALTELKGHLPAFNDTFAEAGLDWHWSASLYRELLQVTGGKERILAYAQQYDPVFATLPDVMHRIAELHATKTRKYSHWVQSGQTTLRGGVAELIGQARDAGLQLAIATTTSMSNVTDLVDNHLSGGVANFAVIGAGDIVDTRKPAPDIYHYVLGQLRLPAPVSYTHLTLPTILRV